MTGILKVDQWKDSGDNALMTSDGAGNLTLNQNIQTPVGSAASPALQIGDNDTGIFDAGANAIGFTTAGTEKVRIVSGGSVAIGATSAAQKLHVEGSIYTSGSLYVGGTGSANALDDYEEGTWTPNFTYTTTTPSFSYVTRSGRYTKIGRLVQIGFQLNVTSINTAGASGEIEITGLPFPCKSQSLATGAVMVYAADVYANTYDVTINVQDNSSNFRFIQSRDNEGWINISTANDAGQLVFQSSFVYDTDS